MVAHKGYDGPQYKVYSSASSCFLKTKRMVDHLFMVIKTFL